ncbi:MAG: methionyl-tRNA formyltransferase [Planctomycetes bacterium]|nr:methionyl-tRNA formyltransferase [Planctomycetota bacterium]
MRPIFFGTPDISVPTLRAMACIPAMKPLAVFTQPAARRSRRGGAEPSPVALAARQLGIECHEVESVNEGPAFERISALAPDVIVVVSFGQILKKAVLGLPKHGCLNMHPSKLPQFRGAAPVQRAVMAGVRESAITIMRLVRKLDAGPILLQQQWMLGEEKTAEELLAEAGERGAAAMLDVLQRLERGENIPEQIQDDAQATLAPPLSKEDGVLDVRRSALELRDQIRGVQPWPRASVMLQPEQGPPRRIIVHDARVITGAAAAKPGGIFMIDKSGILLVTGKGLLEITQCQLEGKSKQPAFAVANGLRLTTAAYFAAPSA